MENVAFSYASLLNDLFNNLSIMSILFYSLVLGGVMIFCLTIILGIQNDWRQHEKRVKEKINQWYQ